MIIALKTLERWTITGSEFGKFCVHDAHMAEKRVRRVDIPSTPCGDGASTYISLLDILRLMGGIVLTGLWAAVARAGGDGWATVRPYTKALEHINVADRLPRASCQAVGLFDGMQNH